MDAVKFVQNLLVRNVGGFGAKMALVMMVWSALLTAIQNLVYLCSSKRPADVRPNRPRYEVKYWNEILIQIIFDYANEYFFN